MKRSKKYSHALNIYDSAKKHEPREAVEIVGKMPKGAYDQTIELNVNLGIDPKQAEQQLRGTVILPQGTGKKKKIAVICKDSDCEAAKKAGAIEAGSADLIDKIQKGWLDFDILITSPDMMSKLGKLGRLLGAKGLMPNIKSGTISKDIVQAITEFSKGKITYRNDKEGNIHLVIGKESFSNEKLLENFKFVYDFLLKEKPSKSKGIYFKKISLSKTHGPGISIETLKTKWGDQ